MTRRHVLKSTLLGVPAALVADTPPDDRPSGTAKAGKISKVEVLSLEKPLKERFWMANSPIGGYQPRASRLIVTIHTDAGLTGHGEGSGGGADLFRKGRRVEARVSFPTGLLASQVTEPYVTALRDYARKEGFADHFQLILS